MGWAAPVIAGIGALGGLFGGGSKTATETGANATQQSGGFSQGGTNFNNTSNNLNPLAAGGFQNVSDAFMSLMGMNGNPTDLSGYQAGQTAQINQNANTTQQSIIDNMALHGITSGPALAAALNQNTSNRMGQVTQLNQQIPLLANQIVSQNAQNAGNFYRGIPLSGTGQFGGQSNSGSNFNFQTQQNHTTATGPSNMLGNMFSSLGNTMAGMYGKNNNAFSNIGLGGS